ncbi:MAG: RNA methyltransferase [Paraprevotella sp.]|nr:RNA methyltransferase [Paraprevotella sp.]
MLSKTRIKQIRSLEQRKYRRAEGLFVAEGHKLVGELLSAGHTPVYLCHTSQWNNVQDNAIQSVCLSCPTDLVSDDELRRISLLQHPQQILALFPIPKWQMPVPQQCAEELMLALDGIQDPGNLGTICRIADWFGIENIICSPDTVDIFNPKAIQATMGAISRVHMHYVDLQKFLHDASCAHIPVYGTFLDGQNIYERTISPHGVIVMGNEGKGISTDIAHIVTERLFIPSYPAERTTTESLNVAVATAIACAEFRRRM